MASKKAKAATTTFDFEPRVVWTPAARKKVPARRGASVKPYVVDGAAAWKRIREVFATVEKEIAAAIERPPKPKEFELDMKGTARAFERLKSKTPPGPPNDLDTEACMHAVLVYTCWKSYEKNVHSSLVHHWLATGGAELAVAALAHVGSHHWYQDRGALAARTIAGKSIVINGAQVDEESWGIVRAFLAGADDATYGKALAIATKIFPKAQVGVHCGLAFAFPDQTQWADAAFESCLAEKKRDDDRFPVCAKMLLATKQDRAFLARVVDELGGIYGDTPFAVADSLGADAFPLLKQTFEALAEGMGPAAAQKKGMSWLSMVESRDAASYFVDLLPHKHLRQAISDYFERAPHLAIVALAKSKDSAAKDFLRLLVTRHPDAADAACTQLGKPEIGVVEALRS